MLDILSHPAWQGVGGIAGIVSIIVSLWLAQRSSHNPKQKIARWCYFAQYVSLILPVYSVFVVSIVFINYFTQNDQTVVYGSAIMASTLGTLWGIVWAIYIRKAFC